VPELVQQAGKAKGSRLSLAQWDVFAAGVNRVAQAIHDELGLSVAFHHHGAGYVETPEEVRNLMQRTIPELVGLCLDTGHWHLGGGDAVQAIHEYGERVRYLHLKDFDPNVQRRNVDENLNYFQALEAGIYCELGKGEVDFPAVLKAMEQLGYDGWAVVEQDVLSDDRDYPTQASRRNRDYLRSLGY
jgi:inosose dehydratase